MSTISSNKRIAKNTIFLYIRMMLVMIVSLYTSRVNLNILGIVDNGIYQVVGGVVALFSFLSNSLSGATSRFLTYEIGKEDKIKLKKTFSAVLIVHCVLALIIVILSEIIGLWFLYNKLNIPAERFHAAAIVFQFSVISSIFSITQVPYNASIIAHERMNIYAYMSILDVCLKLFICLLLYFSPYDKLITFSILTLIVSIFIQLIYRFYCIKNFDECKLQRKNDISIIKPILSFSGWDLFGNFSVMARTQGVNMILNIFFGPVINSAVGFSATIGSTILNFSNNFNAAIRPPIIKAYASGDIKKMQELMINASKISFFLLLLLSTPFLFESEYIIKLWLKNPPPYTYIFCKYELTLSIISSLFLPLVYAIHATGKIRFMSIVNASIWFLTIPITYILLKLGYSPFVPYITKIGLLFFVIVSNIYSVQKYILEFKYKEYLKLSFIPASKVLIISSIPLLIIYHQLLESEELYRFLIICISSSIIISVSSYFFLITPENRKGLLIKIKSKLHYE